ncbi:ABC transporter ATP-binding protein [Acuticoccus sp. MNP-M23]|uniref:ABC transporter ATP-binding protein n=1 Tax=Acuticoccus sp. MNP-M23 TaxID=3072793 RepID=UPI002814FE51|nr:ABC transporter ATP-binding protein [Acuticoccus sp. MNP-M23]WMS41348.1 ABC transporter ATP-binding protein [Acuticoccus sp. MNP-M23]
MMELAGLTKRYGDNAALTDLSLTVADDEYLTLLGPSGSGKSTLLRLIAGLERPDAGRILIDGRDITAEPAHRRGLGIVQQNYALFAHMNVRDNIAFGLRFREDDPVTDAGEVDRRVTRMLGLVGLEGLGERMTNAISGGQKQRVSLARTLITEPRIILLDEPLGALDANLRERMTVELRRIRASLGVTFVHVTGNEAEALAMGDRMIVLDNGRTIMVDAPDNIFARPATTRVARFLNAYNVLEGHTERGTFHVAGRTLPLPPGIAEAAYYAVRYDMASISREGTPGGAASLEGTFIASEFMGSRVIYMIKGPDGRIFEVERHLSRAYPENYTTGEPLTLHWSANDALAFDAAGDLITPTAMRGAA